jgi:hypothetical protein
MWKAENMWEYKQCANVISNGGQESGDDPHGRLAAGPRARDWLHKVKSASNIKVPLKMSL